METWWKIQSIQQYMTKYKFFMLHNRFNLNIILDKHVQFPGVIKLTTYHIPETCKELASLLTHHRLSHYENQV